MIRWLQCAFTTYHSSLTIWRIVKIAMLNPQTQPHFFRMCRCHIHVENHHGHSLPKINWNSAEDWHSIKSINLESEGLLLTEIKQQNAVVIVAAFCSGINQKLIFLQPHNWALAQIAVWVTALAHFPTYPFKSHSPLPLFKLFLEKASVGWQVCALLLSVWWTGQRLSFAFSDFHHWINTEQAQRHKDEETLLNLLYLEYSSFNKYRKTPSKHESTPGPRLFSVLA